MNSILKSVLTETVNKKPRFALIKLLPAFLIAGVFSAAAKAADVNDFTQYKSALTGGADAINLTSDIDWTGNILSSDMSSAANNITLTGNGFIIDGQNSFSRAISTSGAGSQNLSLTVGDGLTFQNFNGTQSGAAAYSFSSSGFSIHMQIGGGVTFQNNTTTAYGAAISNSSSASGGNITTVIGNNALFDTNTSSLGGAIFSEASSGFSSVTIGANARFLNNVATSDNGGAIYNNSTGTSTISIGAGSVFTNNISNGWGGGAILNLAGGAAVISIGDNSSFTGNSGGSGGVIFNGGLTAGIEIGDNVIFSGNTSTGSGGAIYNGSSSGSLINITTSGGTTKFTGNTDSTGANDIYLEGAAPAAIAVLNIDGVSGETIFEGGVSSNNTTAIINKSNGGKLTFGKDVNNANFIGMFNATGGETAFYGQFFENAVMSNITDAALNLWQDTVSAVNLGMLNLNSAKVNTANGQTNSFDIASLGATGTNNFIIDIDGLAGTSDVFNITSGAGGGTINVKSFAMLTDSAADTVDLDVFTGDISGYNFTASAGKTETALYEYTVTSLQSSGGQGSYRLNRSGLSSTANTVANMPALHLTVVKVGMNNLRRHLGELRYDNSKSMYGLWGGGYAEYLKVDEKITASLIMAGMEAGIDYKFFLDDGRLYLGFLGGYLNASNIKIEQTNTFDGKGKADIPNAGLYAAWLNDGGWFADAALRYFWVGMDMRNIASAGQIIDYKTDRDFITGSLETGKAFAAAEFSIEPKAELQYAHAGGKTHGTSANNSVYYGDTDSLGARLSVSAAYLPRGAKTKYRPFIELGIYNEFMGKTDINYAGVAMKSDVGGIGFESALGLNAELTGDMYIYGDIAYEQGQAYQAGSVNLGIRYAFGAGNAKSGK